MTGFRNNRLGVAIGALALVGIGVGAGVFLGRQGDQAGVAAPNAGERRVLYYYDPMYPDRKFDKPGQSPFMNMALVAKYADDGGPAGAAAAGVRIDPALTQNLGLRFAVARMGTLGGDLAATAVVDFNQRDVALVQARADGFVQRVYNRAPGDVIAAGAPLADLLIPSWGGAQGEYLAVRRTGETSLIRAARQRLVLLGMSDALITSVEQSGRPRTVITLKLHIGPETFAAIFDDTESPSDERHEEEADGFARNALLPLAQWDLAVSRFSRTEKAVLTDAKRFGVGPAVIAGRVRREAGDYTVLRSLVGAGEVRRQFGL